MRNQPMRAIKPARPVWAGRIEKFRLELGMSQAALAKRLNVSAMAPSRWERGINQPPASVYIKLGKLAVGSPNGWYFWERAGIRKSDLQTIPDAANGKSGRTGPQQIEVLSYGKKAKLDSNKDRNLLAVPLYETTPAVGVTEPTVIHREEAAEFVVAPLSWCPHPEHTMCLRLSGNRMTPALQHGSIVAIDEAESNPEKLVGKMVLAAHDICGLVVHWLQRYGRTSMLVPENKDFPPYYIENGDWKIMGKVLWWLSKAP
jgi:SOS-response transcriptional repressor LexA/DNA-binding XRE family transcriptional regulator